MPDSETSILRATLDTKLYRDIEIPDTKSLYDLGEAIVEAFDFDLDHAFGFYSKLKGHIFDSPVKYELFADMGESDAQSVKHTRISTAFPKVGTKMIFLFDYGDDWRFHVEMIGKGQKQPRVKYPKIVASVGEAPEQYPDYEEE
jgi:pRiA4b ORF-3-like protein